MTEGTQGGGHRFRQREAFFGRVAGKALSGRQASLFETVLPAYAIALGEAPPADLRTLFPAPVDALRLEIGTGGGEHFLAAADRDPRTGFIGAEAFRNGVAKLLAALAEHPRPNVRLHPEDATVLLDWLPPGSLDGIDLFYPDPWPKPKHWKRRFVCPRNLDRMARAVRSGGTFRFASDIGTYVEWTLAHVRDHGAFERVTRGEGDDRREPFPDWPGTRYEAKALREGRPPAYLAFCRRRDADA